MASASSQALAVIHMGDWNMLFNRKTSALRHYAEAYTIMETNGESLATINELFDKPKRLPVMQVPMQYGNTLKKADQETDKESDPSYVLTSFDVNKYGRARNIKIIESSPDSSSLRRKAKKIVRSTRFRPRLENGEPVSTKDVNLRYIFQE